MAAVALAAAALSYQSLTHLGELAGYGDLSVLYPLVVDAGAAASCAAWLHTRGRQPLVVMCCLLGISVLLNGTVHCLESTGTALSWLLVVAVAAVPPTVLGLCVHLAMGIGATRPSGGPNLAEPRSPVLGTVCIPAHEEVQTNWRRPGQDEREGVPAGSATLRSDRLQGDTDVTSDPKASYVNSCDDRVAALVAQGADRRRRASEVDISEQSARKLLEAARNGSSDVPA